MKKVASLLVVFLFAGCANSRYFKDGASAQDWQRDNNDCLVKANQAGYPGGDFSANLNRRNFIDMCLKGQGWHEHTKEVAQLQQQQKQTLDQKRGEYKNKMTELNEKIRATCAKPEYSSIVAKTPCSPNDATFEQMADSSKLKSAMKKIYLKYRAETTEVNTELRGFIRANLLADTDRQWADYLDSTQQTTEAISLDLYNGKITWGEYNKSRKDLMVKMQGEWAKIFQAKR